MTSGERAPWSEIKRILADALERPPAERADFLDEACEGRPELRREVASLVREHDGAGPLDDMQEELRSLVGAIVELAPGDPIGRFRVVRELGRGGMGVVYLARREGADFEQLVAIKVVGPGRARDVMGRRLREERRILASLDHPGIARFLDGDLTPEGLPYLVMEYVEGAPIDGYVEERRLAVRDRVELFRDVLAAVQYAHQHLVVHQDIKPSNILVRSDGAIRLLDFGVARLLADDSEPRREARGHTPGYASPEQLRGDAATLASDIFSLGVLLRVLLTGSIDELEKGSVGADLEAIVRCATAADPHERYATVEQFDHDLAAWSSHRPVRAHAGGRRYRAIKFARRNRVGLGAAAAVLVALLTGLAATATQARRAEEQARLAAEQRDLSQQVSDILVGMFELSDPGVALGETVTAREILDRAAGEVDRSLAGQPQAQARLLHEIGRVYHNLGLEEQALEAATRALAIHRSEPGTATMEIETLRLVADLRSDEGDAEAAVRLLDEALVALRAQVPVAESVIAETLSQLAFVRRGRAEYEEAEAAWTEALDLVADGSHDELRADILYGLALARHDQSDFAGAEVRFREAVDLFPARGPRDRGTPSAAAARHRLGQLLMIRGDAAEAEILLEEALAMQSRLFEPGHRDRLATLRTLATLRVNAAEYEEGASLLEEAHRLSSASLGSEHPDVAQIGYLLGAALIRVGREDEAVTLLTDAVRVYTATYGATHPYLVTPAHVLSQARHLAGDVDGATEAAITSLEAAKANYGEDHLFAVQGLAQVGLRAAATGMTDSASVTLRTALDRGVRAAGSEHRIVIRAQISMGSLLLAQGRAREAEELLRGVVDVVTRTQGPNNPLRADSELGLGRALVALGRPDEARAVLTAALGRREASLPPDHHLVGEVREALAGISSR